MRYISFFIILSAIIFSCSVFRDNPSKMAAVDKAQTVKSFKSVADMNDAYFQLKENNYFEFYRQLFDSVKNTRYAGIYSSNMDTLYLNFFDKKGEALLGKKAVVKGDDIIFFK